MRSSALVLAYHGCDLAVGEELVVRRSDIRPSEGPHEWLGHGAYFWENSVQRALEWAEFLKARPRDKGPEINIPCVVGAVVELGNCLDLTEAESLKLTKEAHAALTTVFECAGMALPVNSKGQSKNDDLLLRNLDCAVINHLHASRKLVGEEPYDTVRGAFFEGDPLYPGAAIMAKTHVQLCVRNFTRIRGFFWPRV